VLQSRVVEPPDLLVATLHGVVTSNDQTTLVTWVRGVIQHAGAVRVLILLEEFAGWKPDASLEHAASWLGDDERISRMAIVGDRKWRQALLTIVAQPVRRIPIEYFDTETAARRWLTAHRAGIFHAMLI
jgi:hypothetical protein